jgi:hypothetical protein
LDQLNLCIQLDLSDPCHLLDQLLRLDPLDPYHQLDPCLQLDQCFQWDPSDPYHQFHLLDR